MRVDAFTVRRHFLFLFDPARECPYVFEKLVPEPLWINRKSSVQDKKTDSRTVSTRSERLLIDVETTSSSPRPSVTKCQLCAEWMKRPKKHEVRLYIKNCFQFLKLLTELDAKGRKLSKKTELRSGIGHNAPILGRTDLALRWPHYSKVAVWKWTNRDDFPIPAGAINRGKHIFWSLPDIEEYEALHPELRSVATKDAKVRWFNTHFAEILDNQ